MANARGGTSIRARLFLLVGLPVAVLVLGLGGFAWRGARTAVGDAIEQELRTVAAVAASTVNPAPARFLLPGDEGTRTYKRLQARLAALQKATGSSRVVLVGADQKVRADASGKLALLGPAPRLSLDRAEFARALAGQPTVSVPFEDGGGRRYLAAYARVPERDDGLTDDAVPMVLAIEAPAELLDLTDEVAAWLIAGSSFALLLVFLFAALVARTITAPLLRLAEEAELLGRGRLAQPLWVPDGRDELALLGETLEAMRQALLMRDQERQMMLAGIAHEVRNPLGGMELFSGLLEEQLEELATAPDDGGPWIEPDIREDLTSHAQRVRRELRYLTGVVNDFLAFARDLPIQREPVDVAGLLEDVRSLRSSFGGPRLTIACEAEGTFPLDRGRIKEALLNLIANAQQATPEDGEVVVSARKDVDGLLVLEVKDSGSGMSDEQVERVFTPFFTTKEKGSGLGLPLVRKFARDHGGDATLESKVGEGTCVRLTLAEGKVDVDTSDGGAPWTHDESEPVLLGDG
jgi:signal transduction histidine kinase